MTQQNNEFEKWWAQHYNQLDHRDILRTSERAYQDATTESAKEIAELKADNETLVAVNNKLSNEIVELNEMYEGRIDHLDAHINDLRDALLTTQDALSQLAHHGIEQWAKDRASYAYDYIEKALAATPAQSLQAHDDEVIERCAEVMQMEGLDGYANSIRALIEKELNT